MTYTRAVNAMAIACALIVLPMLGWMVFHELPAARREAFQYRHRCAVAGGIVLDSTPWTCVRPEGIIKLP
jgi:hypothetical protein